MPAIAPVDVANDDHPKRFLVCYDIQTDACRARAAKVLSGYGSRVQFSVFECCLAPRELRRMKRALQRIPVAQADRLEIFECSQTSPFGGMTRFTDRPFRYWLA
jgi:CRISPR-associated protein Cas2